MFYLKFSMCPFLESSIEYLGRIISEKESNRTNKKLNLWIIGHSHKYKTITWIFGTNGFLPTLHKKLCFHSFALTELLEKDEFKWDSKAQNASQ